MSLASSSNQHLMLSFTAKQRQAPRPRAAPISIATATCSHTRFRSLKLSHSLPVSVMSLARPTYASMSQPGETVRSDARNLLRQWVCLKYRRDRRCHHYVSSASPIMIKMVFLGPTPSKRVFGCHISRFRHEMSAREARERCCRLTRLSRQ